MSETKEAAPMLGDADAEIGFACGRSNTWNREMRLAVLADWERARASEVEKDATIKALSDALERHGWACRRTLRRDTTDCHCAGCQSARTLRLAGRLT